MAGLRPSWSLSRIATALFSHSVRSHSSSARHVRQHSGVEHVRDLVCPEFVQRGYLAGWIGVDFAVP